MDNKGIAQIETTLRDKGFAFIRRTKHGYLWRDKAGKSVVVPTTPSDNRSIKNLTSAIRRLDR